MFGGPLFASENGLTPWRESAIRAPLRFLNVAEGECYMRPSALRILRNNPVWFGPRMIKASHTNVASGSLRREQQQASMIRDYGNN